MKGRISPRLKQILRDPVARKELREALENRGGIVRLDDTQYEVIFNESDGHE